MLRASLDLAAEWVLVDAAMHAYSMVSVPLYDTLGPDAVEYITNHAELSAIACSAAMLPSVLQALPSCPNVRLLVRACMYCTSQCIAVCHVFLCMYVCVGCQWQPAMLS